MDKQNVTHEAIVAILHSRSSQTVYVNGVVGQVRHIVEGNRTPRVNFDMPPLSYFKTAEEAATYAETVSEMLANAADGEPMSTPENPLKGVSVEDVKAYIIGYIEDLDINAKKIFREFLKEVLKTAAVSKIKKSILDWAKQPKVFDFRKLAMLILSHWGKTAPLA